jgi:hypothetical protein
LFDPGREQLYYLSNARRTQVGPDPSEEPPLADDEAEQPHKPQLISAKSDVSQRCQPRMAAHRSTRPGAAQAATLATEFPPIAADLAPLAPMLSHRPRQLGSVTGLAPVGGPA